jgi:hypothetical protein
MKLLTKQVRSTLKMTFKDAPASDAATRADYEPT